MYNGVYLEKQNITMYIRIFRQKSFTKFTKKQGSFLARGLSDSFAWGTACLVVVKVADQPPSPSVTYGMSHLAG